MFQQGDEAVEVGYRQTAGGSMFLRFPVSSEWVPAGPVVGVYDPAAMLDPARGVARLLSTATGGQTAGAEQVDGVAAWRVEVVLDQHALDTFVPFAGNLEAAVLPSVDDVERGLVELLDY